MWKKQWQKYPGLVYRKRFKCPKCTQYSFKIEHDYFGECENGCFINDENIISEIIRQDNYNGYYTLEEIDDYFINIDQECNKILSEIQLPIEEKIYSKEEVLLINNLFGKSLYIDDLLDDFYIYNIRFNKQIENTDMDNKRYLLNLIEDAHFFVNQALNELILYEHFSLNNSPYFYSGRFALNNACFHTIMAWERSINILAILYSIALDNNIKRNSFNNIYSKLKKDADFRKTTLYTSINNLKCNHILTNIDKIRKFNDHDLSWYINDMKKYADKNKESELFDESVLKYISKDILQNIDCLYEILEVSIKNGLEKIKKETDIQIHSSIKIDLKNDYNNMIQYINSSHVDIEKSKKIYEHIVVELEKWIDISQTIPIRQLANNDEKFNYILFLFNDIVFRCHEISRCLLDSSNPKAAEVYRMPDYLINKQYFIYSSIYRIYSLYDKLSRLIAKLFNLTLQKEQFYFEDFIIYAKENNICVSNKIISDFSNISTKSSYEGLDRMRNRLFHIIRPGAINGEEGVNIFEEYMTLLCIENIQFIIPLLPELINEIMQYNKNMLKIPKQNSLLKEQYTDIQKTLSKLCREYDNNIERRNRIKKFLINQLKTNCSDGCEINTYKNKLLEVIKNKILLFNREVLVFCAEFIREMYIGEKNNGKINEKFISIYQMALTMQQQIVFYWNDFKNSKWYVNTVNLQELCEILSLYNSFCNNIEVCDADISFERIDDLFEPTNDKEYTDTTQFKEYDSNVKKIIDGFQSMTAYQVIKRHICIPKEMFIYFLSNSVGEEQAEVILNDLCLNRLSIDSTNFSSNGIAQRCIMENNENLYFGVYTLLDILGYFKTSSI